VSHLVVFGVDVVDVIVGGTDQPRSQPTPGECIYDDDDDDGVIGVWSWLWR
jgi:hypothetical protein